MGASRRASFLSWEALPASLSCPCFGRTQSSWRIPLRRHCIFFGGVHEFIAVCGSVAFGRSLMARDDGWWDGGVRWVVERVVWCLEA
jgi:hypothetical protein